MTIEFDTTGGTEVSSHELTVSGERELITLQSEKRSSSPISTSSVFRKGDVHWQFPNLSTNDVSDGGQTEQRAPQEGGRQGKRPELL